MSKHYGSLNEVKELMISEARKNNGMVNIGYKEIADKLGMGNLSTARNMVLKLIEQKVIQVETAPKRGTQDACYRLTQSLTPSIITPIKEEDKFERVSLGGLEFMLLKTEDIGLCMSKDDLSVALIESGDTISKILKSNSELFEKHMTIYNETVFLNRRAIQGVLLKLNLDRVVVQKKEALKLFNETIMNHLTEAHLFGRVVLLENDKIMIRNNLSNLTGLNISEVEQLFHKLEDDFSTILSGVTQEINSVRQEASQVNKKMIRVSNLLETEKQRHQICLTQTRELSAKLLERSSN